MQIETGHLKDTYRQYFYTFYNNAIVMNTHTYKEVLRLITKPNIGIRTHTDFICNTFVFSDISIPNQNAPSVKKL